MVPDNRRINQDVLIPIESAGDASHGQIVVATIVSQPDQHRQPIGSIKQVLGDHMAPGMEIDIAIRAHSLPYEWPEAVLDQAGNIPMALPQDEVARRIDLRDIAFVTIDGEDARDFDDAPWMLAVTDAEGGGGPGGAIDTVSAWKSAGLAVDVVDLTQLRSEARVSVLETVRAVPVREAGALDAGKVLHREVRTMLFADVVGYSRLSEEHTPAFLVGFLSRVAQLVDGMQPAPELVNTWGDGLFMVFADAMAAADFALQLRDMVTSVDWAAEGLPADLHLRIGLHVGPVYPADDPLLHRRNVFGTQVTRAARIEPIAAADSVFISAEAAYALAANGQDRFCADYLGTLPLAKGYGSQPMYRLRRASDMF